MRWIAVSALLVGCGSESGLYSGLHPDDAPTTSEPAPVPPEGEASLKGLVCTPNGNGGVAGATVTVLTDDPVTGTTDQDGRFRIDGLPPGKWDVEISKGSFVQDYTVKLVDGQVTNLDPGERCVPLDQGDLKIAVVTGQYDKIQDLLDQLGLDYDIVKGITGNDHVQFLRDPAALAKYDLIFFNCGLAENWTSYRDEVTANLKDYVKNGGSIYASDWAYLLVERTWPDEIDFVGDDTNNWAARVGTPQNLTADVLDPSMKTVLGSDSAKLSFNLDEWATMSDAKADVLIDGTYKYRQSGVKSENGPLAVQFDSGGGTVIYTSFHNESQTTDDMLKLLSEMILSL